MPQGPQGRCSHVWQGRALGGWGCQSRPKGVAQQWPRQSWDVGCTHHHVRELEQRGLVHPRDPKDTAHSVEWELAPGGLCCQGCQRGIVWWRLGLSRAGVGVDHHSMRELGPRGQGPGGPQGPNDTAHCVGQAQVPGHLCLPGHLFSECFSECFSLLSTSQRRAASLYCVAWWRACQLGRGNEPGGVAWRWRGWDVGGSSCFELGQKPNGESSRNNCSLWRDSCGSGREEMSSEGCGACFCESQRRR